MILIILSFCNNATDSEVLVLYFQVDMGTKLEAFDIGIYFKGALKTEKVCKFVH